ncbi:MAG: cation:proton antiporter [Gammaproteobacteria bacterium]|nr:cation:proton antiporter [Gammaproteobacteria bacterium]MBQ0838859.1 cation:proton antiporter [Gammaproteobacteria bacterium]
MFYHNLLFMCAFLFVYSVFAGRLESRWIHGALMFVLVGILFGPAVLDVLHFQIRGPGIGVIAEITLAIVLFTDAANVNFKVLRTYNWLPSRLLLIGLPLCLLSGWGFGLLLFDDMPWLEVAILATIVAPTDAALGKAVVTNPAVPAPMREGLNMESGLNDGICVPLLLILLAIVAPIEEGHGTVAHALLVILEEIGIGLLVGAGLAYISAALMKVAIKRKWNSPLWDQLTLMSLAVLAFTMAQELGGSGFIAAFVCGLIAGPLLENKHSYLEHNEGFADLLSVLVWVLFGAVILTNTWPHFSWKTWTYAIASLTLLRMLPVWLSLVGTTLGSESRLFMGWFGPRGLATIVFGVIVMEYELVAMEEIVATAVCAVLLSVVFHGLTANPWVARLRRQAAMTKN